MQSKIYYGDGRTLTFGVPGSTLKLVYLNGVLTAPASSTFSSVTFATPPAAGVPIDIEWGEPFNPGDATVKRLPPVYLTAATILYRDLHFGCQLINVTLTAVTHTMATDAQAQAAGYAVWGVGEGVDMIALAGTAGIPTIATPDGKTMTLTTSNIGATCTGSNQWYVGTTAGLSILAPPDLTRILAFDQFARANVAPATVALGVTPFGNRAWAGNASGAGGITAGKAYFAPTGGFPQAVIDCGVLDVDITQTITLNGEEARLTARANTSNSVGVVLSLNGLLYFWDGSATQGLVSFTGFTTGTHTARLVVKGNTVTGFMDGAQVATFTYQGLSTTTFAGFSDLSNKSRFGPIQILTAA